MIFGRVCTQLTEHGFHQYAIIYEKHCSMVLRKHLTRQNHCPFCHIPFPSVLVQGEKTILLMVSTLELLLRFEEFALPGWASIKTRDKKKRKAMAKFIPMMALYHRFSSGGEWIIKGQVMEEMEAEKSHSSRTKRSKTGKDDGEHIFGRCT